MSRQSLPVVLSETELSRLAQWIRARSTPQQVVLRARIIRSAAAGQSDKIIATELSIRRETAALWRRRVREQGIGCVWEIAPGRGRKPRYAAAQVGRWIKATLQTKPAGATHWSTRSLARSQGVSKNTIQRAWQDHGLKPHLTKTFKLSRDLRFLEKLTDVVGVYLAPPQNAVVLCVDEKSQIQALDRSVPELQHAIFSFLEAWNTQPTPFVWTASVERILEKVNRARQRLEQIKPGSTRIKRHSKLMPT